MPRLDLSDLRRPESPRERMARWFEEALALFGLTAIAWFIGDSFLTLMSSGGWVAALTVLGLMLATLLWFWWSAWSRRAKIFCTLLFVLSLGVPLMSHYG